MSKLAPVHELNVGGLGGGDDDGGAEDGKEDL